MTTYEVMIDNARLNVHCRDVNPGPPPGNYELNIYPTVSTIEGANTAEHTPMVVAPDSDGNSSPTAFIDSNDATYVWGTNHWSPKGVYPRWDLVDPGSDPSAPEGLTEIHQEWITAIGFRCRVKGTPGQYMIVQLFGNVSKLLSQPSYGSLPPHQFTDNIWNDFEYVFDSSEYDISGWAPNGMQSALDITSYLYTRMCPTDSTGTFSALTDFQVSEQHLVLFYTIP